MITTYGYVRVSSKDQNEDRQLAALQELKQGEISILINSPEKILTGCSIRGWCGE